MYRQPTTHPDLLAGMFARSVGVWVCAAEQTKVSAVSVHACLPAIQQRVGLVQQYNEVFWQLVELAVKDIVLISCAVNLHASLP